MKVTLYRADGKVEREVECETVVPQQSGWNLLLGKANGIGQSEILMYTTMPYSIVSKGQHPEHEHLLQRIDIDDESFDVSLRMGNIVREWKGAKAFLFQGKMATFWHKGEWWDVIGQVIVEPRKRKQKW